VFDVFISLLTALFLSILIECVIAFAFGFRERTLFLAVATINLITNPILNYLILIIQSLALFRVDFFVLLIFEFGVVFVEWRLLAFSAFGNAKKVLLLSLAMNLCSFASGLLIFALVQLFCVDVKKMAFSMLIL